MRSREAGQVLVLFAVFLVVLMVLAGSAYDYGSIVLDDARLQNAIDAAALAGADSLSQNAAQPAGTPVAVAQATTTAYLALNGVATATPGTNVQVAFPTSTPVPGATPSAVHDTISLSVQRTHPTAFWPLVGINSVTTQGSASAHAARGMTDIMLSLDLTGSEQLSGSLTSIQQAAVNFINQMNPSTTDPRGPQIGVARFAGIKCNFNSAGTYVAPCADDYTLLSGLSSDKASLLAIADPSTPGAGACPAGVSPYGCPLTHVAWTSPTSANCQTSPFCPYYTGTKLPNAVTALGLIGGTFTSQYAWSTANGGRNDSPSGTGWARKVMVMMTDGQNEAWPDPSSGNPSYWKPPNYPQDVLGWDTQVTNAASTLKLGPDGAAGTPDDVEIYVVGYFCAPYKAGYPPTNNFCASELADTTSPHPCPSNTLPDVAQRSAVDDLLISISSSTPGTCDHYYPLLKTESLPQLFQQLAGTISRGQLTQ